MTIYTLLLIDIITTLPFIIIIVLFLRARKKAAYRASPEGQREAAEQLRKRRAKELHDFTDRSELPMDLELLKEMKAMYDKEGDEHRSLMCLMRMGESGDWEAACDAAEIMSATADATQNWASLHAYLKPIAKNADNSTLGQRVRRLSLDAEEMYEFDMGNRFVSEEDYARARMHYGNIATKRNHPRASELFAQCCFLTAKSLKDYDLAEEHILKAEKGGQDVSKTKLPILQERRYRYGLDYLEKQQYDTAIDYFAEATELGDPEAAAAGARTIMKHGSCKADWILANEMAEMAARAGLMNKDEELMITLTSISKITEMSKLLQEGYDAYKGNNINEAVKKLSKASDLGSGNASAILAEILLEHSKNEENLEVAKKYAVRAKQQERRSDLAAYATLEKKIQSEIYCTKAWDAQRANDLKTAISFWTKAAELGHVQSAFMAASNLGENASTSKDLYEAARLAKLLLNNPHTGDGMRDLAEKLVYQYEINALIKENVELLDRKEYYSALDRAKQAYEKGHKAAAYNVAVSLISDPYATRSKLIEARNYAEIAREYMPEASQKLINAINDAL